MLLTLSHRRRVASMSQASSVSAEDAGLATLARVRLHGVLVGYDRLGRVGRRSAFALRLTGKHAEATLVHVCPDLKQAPHAAHTALPDALLASAQRLTRPRGAAR
jgi:hypothetical protein